MSLETMGLIVMCVFMGIAIICTVVDHEASKPKRKSNVRLPRRVAWDRAAKYYSDTH